MEIEQLLNASQQELDDLIAEINSSFEPVIRNKPYEPSLLSPVARKPLQQTVLAQQFLQTSTVEDKPAKGLAGSTCATPSTQSELSDGEFVSQESARRDDKPDGDDVSFTDTPVAMSLPGTPPSKPLRAACNQHTPRGMQCAPRAESAPGSTRTTSKDEPRAESAPGSTGATSKATFQLHLQDRMKGNQDHGSHCIDTSSHPISTPGKRGLQADIPRQTPNPILDAKPDVSEPTIMDLVQGFWETRKGSEVFISGTKATWIKPLSNRTATIVEVNPATAEMSFDDCDSTDRETWQGKVVSCIDGGPNLLWSDGDRWKKMRPSSASEYCMGQVQNDQGFRRSMTPPEISLTGSQEPNASDSPSQGDRNIDEKPYARSESARSCSSTMGSWDSDLLGSCSGTCEELRRLADHRRTSLYRSNRIVVSARMQESNVCDLQGVWMYMGRIVAKGPVKVVIEGDTATWPDSYINRKAKITVKGNEYVLQFEGCSDAMKYYAALRPEDGALCWSDGAVWTQVSA